MAKCSDQSFRFYVQRTLIEHCFLVDFVVVPLAIYFQYYSAVTIFVNFSFKIIDLA